MIDLFKQQHRIADANTKRVFGSFLAGYGVFWLVNVAALGWLYSPQAMPEPGPAGQHWQIFPTCLFATLNVLALGMCWVCWDAVRRLRAEGKEAAQAWSNLASPSAQPTNKPALGLLPPQLAGYVFTASAVSIMLNLAAWIALPLVPRPAVPMASGATHIETASSVVPVDAAVRKYVYAGLPGGTFQLTILTNIAYLVGYDETLKAPRWVAYRLTRIGEVWQKVTAPSRTGISFKTDLRTQAKVTDANYTGIGNGIPGDPAKYDRGHMAPNASIANDFGTEAQQETFTLSNIAIQKHSLNGETWAYLEDLEARGVANFYTNVWIIDGPIFNENPTRFGDARIAIPASFFKVLLVETGGQPHVEAVIMDQQVKGMLAANPGVYKTLREVETQTGLSFFDALPAPLRSLLEAENAQFVLPPQP